jgi:outer membrane receptor protein involved in Fe transport
MSNLVRAMVAATAVFIGVTGAAIAQQTERIEVPGTTVNVTATPLPGVDLPKEQVAAPVQAATGEEIEKSGALDLSDFLRRRLADVHVNEMQGNPFQMDVNYRGYTASPLLGTPQGLSVYMDGVRLNQPFGDVVSWDLIPRIAISSTALMPGSNPMFGLNTLGGALSIQTKSGVTHKGGSLRALYGSYERKALEVEYGGSTGGGWNWYLAGNQFGENGWRSDSHSDVRQMFGKFGWQDPMSDVSLTLSYANNSLTGNGLQDNRLLDRDRSSIYTRPDNTRNKAAFVNLAGRHALSAKLSLSGNIYYRDIRTRTLNGDINEDSLDQTVYQPNAAERAALTAAGYTGFPVAGETVANTPFPKWRCIANVLLQDEPAEKCNGLINRGQSSQHNFGLSGQINVFGEPNSNKNLLTVGAAYDRSRIAFGQSSQLGFLNPDRSISGLPAFGDGATGGDVDGEPFDVRVDLDGIINTYSVYAANTFSADNAWHVTVSGRYNRTTVDNRDGINPGGGPGSLDGNHTFQRLNPAVGVTYSPAEHVNIYLGYAEGSRAATSIELGCADPEEPCRLPNAMAGDPPLEQVVTRTWEAGVRSVGGPVNWNVGFFHADNNNDILFVMSEQTGFGYFRNFGKTRREGIEAGASGTTWEKVTIGGGYTLLHATYQSAEEINGTGNSSNEEGPGFEGTIEIEPGDRLPLTPRHVMKTFLEYQPTSRLSFDVALLAASSSIARGNENNEHESDGVRYFGPGRSAGYGVVDAGARFQLHPRLELVAQLNNVFNKGYATAAQLGSTGFTAEGNFIARPFPAVNGEFPLAGVTFFAPGAPRTFWVGTRVKF